MEVCGQPHAQASLSEEGGKEPPVPIKQEAGGSHSQSKCSSWEEIKLLLLPGFKPQVIQPTAWTL